MDTIKLIDNIVNGYIPNIKELTNILDSNDEITNYLFKTADSIRRLYCGNEVHLRAIIEFSNCCRCKCLYCGLNCENSSVQRYRMSPEEIILNAKETIEAGYKTIVLQSGEDLWYTKDMVSYIVKEIKKLDDISITLSIGERKYNEYMQWFKDGADRYLIKHETADETLYNRLHPHSNFKNRLKCLKELNEIGYQVGSGFMIGLPGQTTETIAKDILLLKELEVDMAGIGPFIAHQSTPLKDVSSGSPIMTLKAVALSRILIKKVHLPATTALGVITKSKIAADSSSQSLDQGLPFNCGANVLMKKVEPYEYRKLYDIYPKPEAEIKTIKEERLETEKFILDIGREISLKKGDSLKLNYLEE